MNTNKRVVVLSIIFAFASTFCIYSYIKSLNKGIEYGYVYVAKEDIPSKTKIEASMVEVKKMDKRNILSSVVSDSSGVVGKFASDRILKGEQILTGRLSDSESNTSVFTVPENKRALTIAVDNISGIADLIQPGNHVDVFLFLNEKETKQTPPQYYPDSAKMILQDILVLRVDRGADVSEVADMKETSREGIKYVTLALEPGEAEKLILGDEIGKIRLGLRNYNDTSIVNTKCATIGSTLQ